MVAQAWDPMVANLYGVSFGGDEMFFFNQTF